MNTSQKLVALKKSVRSAELPDRQQLIVNSMRKVGATEKHPKPISAIVAAAARRLKRGREEAAPIVRSHLRKLRAAHVVTIKAA